MVLLVFFFSFTNILNYILLPGYKSYCQSYSRFYTLFWKLFCSFNHFVPNWICSVRCLKFQVADVYISMSMWL